MVQVNKNIYIERKYALTEIVSISSIFQNARYVVKVNKLGTA